MKLKEYLALQNMQINPNLPKATKSRIRTISRQSKKELLGKAKTIIGEKEKLHDNLSKPHLIYLLIKYTELNPERVFSPLREGETRPLARTRKRREKEEPEQAPKVVCEFCHQEFTCWQTDLVMTRWDGKYRDYCRDCKKQEDVPSFEEGRVSVSLFTNQKISL